MTWLIGDKDHASLKREAEDRQIWRATNRREMLKTCFTADNWKINGVQSQHQLVVPCC